MAASLVADDDHPDESASEISTARNGDGPRRSGCLSIIVRAGKISARNIEGERVNIWRSKFNALVDTTLADEYPSWERWRRVGECARRYPYLDRAANATVDGWQRGNAINHLALEDGVEMPDAVRCVAVIMQQEMVTQ